MDKNTYIANKVKKLMNEGKSQAQSLAISYSMFEREKDKMQQGGETELPKYQLAGFTRDNNVTINGQKVFPQPYSDLTNMLNSNMKPQSSTPGNEIWAFPQTTYRGKPMQAQNTQSQNVNPLNPMGWDMPKQQSSNSSNPFYFPTSSPKVNDVTPQQSINTPQQSLSTPEQVNPTQQPEGTISLTPEQLADDSPMVDMSVYNRQTPQSPIGGYNDFVKYNTLNPYGGIDPLAGLSYGLYNFGAGNNAKGLLGVSRFGLGALREGLSAYGAGKNDRQVWENYIDQQYNQPPRYEYQQEGGYIDYMKEGGKTIADMMTGNYIAEDPNPNAPKNVEVEDGEYIKNSQTQEIAEAVGEKHKNGGVKVNLPAESKVLSDFTKVGVTNAKELKERFDVSIKAKDTFADVLDKYKKKIGAEKLEKEEVEYMKEIEKQLKANISEKTKQINLDFLGKELEEVQAKKTEMQKKIDEAFEILFNEQEKLPKKNSSPMMQEGGNIPPEIAQLAEQYGIPVEKAMELIAQQQGQEQPQSGDIMQQVMSMLQQGTSPEQIVQELVSAGYPQEEAVAIIEQVMAQAQGSPQQEQIPTNEEGMPMAQKGLKTMSDWTKSQMYKAEYELGDVEQTAQRFKELADNVGLEYTADDFKDMNSLNKFAGKLQQKVIKDKPELAYNYGLGVEPTRQGLQYLVDNKLIDAKELGIKIQDGKVARGSYDTLSEESLNKINTTIQSLPENTKNEYALKNYNDNLAYFRGIKYKDFNLSKEEFDNYLNENKDKLVGNSGYYKTEVPGVYVKPNLQTPNKETTQTDINLQNNQPINRQVTKNIVPLLPYFGQLPPNSMQIPKKQEISLGRHQAYEVNSDAEIQENTRATLAKAMSYANLAPEVAASMQAIDNLALQEANNKAIANAKMFNAQARSQADMFNIQQGDREEITNKGLEKRYEQEMFATLANQEQDWRRYYNAEALQQHQKYMDTHRNKLTGERYENYAYNASTGQVDFLNPATFGSNENSQNKQLEVLMNSAKTPEERMALQKQLIERMNLNNKTT